MNVLGFEVSQETLAMLVARMQHAPFGSYQIESCAESLGVPRHDGVAMRCADRLIQLHRKRGDLRREGRMWTWVGAKA
jgi:hypothetical protein